MNELWAPFWQGRDGAGVDRVVFGDLRLMGDDQENREFNLGTGYRQYLPEQKAVVGGMGWVDRRLTKLGSRFHQFTVSGEWLSDKWDLRVNAYVPLSKRKERITGAETASAPYLAGTGIYYESGGQTLLIEEPQKGLDLEIGWKIPFMDGLTDSTRIYAAVYHFRGDKSEDVTGWRTRIASDITENFQIGARFQHDDERGSQGFVEATIRFPFGHKKSYRREGVRSRLDESPERDIDIVTGSKEEVAPSRTLPVLNTDTGQPQRVLYVDNSAAGGGDGSLDNPYNDLTVAQGALLPQDVLYIAHGLGTSAGMNSGLSITQNGVQVIGEGSNFTFKEGRYSAGESTGEFNGTVLRAAGLAPILTNLNPNGDGVTIAASDVLLSGVTISGAARHGIYAFENGGSSLDNLTIRNVRTTGNTEDGVHIEADGAGSSVIADLRLVTADGNKNGMRFLAQNNSSVTTSVQSSSVTTNTDHGVIIYDNSVTGAVDADLGGGTKSTGGNSFFGNGDEDLVVDSDGATILAQNNWWGQAGGALNPQIRIGFLDDDPLSMNLVAHWTFDQGDMSGTSVTDLSGRGNTGTLQGGLTATDLVDGHVGQAMTYNGPSQYMCMDVNGPCTSSADFDGAVAARTFSVWFKTADIATRQNIIDEGGGTNGLNIYVSGGNVYVGAWGKSSGWNGAYLNAPITANEWHNAVLTFDAGTIAMYLDGAYVNSVGGGSATVPGHTGDDSIAAVRNDTQYHTGTFSGNGDYFNGSIDDTRVYNYAINANEAFRLFSLGGSEVDDSSALAAAP